MRQSSWLLVLGMFLCAGCAVTTTRVDAGGDERAWYLASNKAGVSANDVRPVSIGQHVRQAFRAPSIEAKRDNSWIIWVSTWPKPGSNNAKVYVESLTLEAIAPMNRAIHIYTQRYTPGEVVWGGWFPYNDNQWYQMGMRDEHDFTVGSYVVDGTSRFVGAILDVGKHADLPAAGHIWQKRWPRDRAPKGTERMRLRARFAVTGEAFINVGMDRFRLVDADPQPQQEVLVSDTYDASHGIVDVVMDTVPITWQP